MRDVPATISAAWREGLYIGERRPIARVTVQHPRMRLHNFSLMSTATGQIACNAKKQTAVVAPIDFGGKVSQTYSNFLFSKLHVPKELPNVKSVSWDRTIEGDVASCTIVAWNTKPSEPGEAPNPGELDYPGWYTYSRGAAAGGAFARWKYKRNAWFGMLMPDNLIRTYEGYGCDPEVIAEKDPHLVPTGVWIIDKVTLTDDGLITIACRDIGRILLDQLFMDPVIPKKWQNKGFESWKGLSRLLITDVKKNLTADRSSGNTVGHPVGDAFDGSPNSFWQSPGITKPSASFSYQWVQGKIQNNAVNKVRIRTRKNGYTFYVSVRINGVWQGAQVIPYRAGDSGTDNGSGIPYVATGVVESGEQKTITLDTVYEVVTHVRITLTNLQDFRTGNASKYKAAVREIEVWGPGVPSVVANTVTGFSGANPGRYKDYTDIVKLCCAWAGFYWPEGGHQRFSDGTLHSLSPSKRDKTLGVDVPGRVWGDFMQSGTVGLVALDAQNFDKKSLMDCIAYVRDVLGFVFYIDETGGCVWRLPNVYNYGCWVGAFSAKPGYRPGFVHTIDENSVLLQLSVDLDSTNVREAFFVGDTNGQVGAYSPGFNPNPTGLRRVAGWTDQNFAPQTDLDGKTSAAEFRTAQREAEMMADMIALRQLFLYRQDQVRIPANPAIQIDDQIRINERTTAEGYVHYVKGISSSLDMESGEWVYDLTTTWLGYDPKVQWLFNADDLYESTQERLALQRAAAEEAPAVKRPIPS